MIGKIGAMLSQQAMNTANNVGNALSNYAMEGMDELFGIRKHRENVQLSMQDRLNKQQANTQMGLMNHAHQLNKDFFDYSSPAKRVQQLKDAGLSIGLMYGGSGGGGSTVAPSGVAQVTGGHATTVGEMKANAIQMQGMALQNAKLNAEIKVLESQAEKNKADADFTGGASTDKVRAEIELLFNESEIAENNAWITKIDADFAFQMKNALIDNILSNRDVNIKQKDYIEKSTDLISSNIRKIDQEINNLIKQENLTEEQIKLVKKEVAQITANILQKWVELRLKGESIDVQRQHIQALIDNNIRDNKTKVGVGKLQKSGTIMGGVQTILNEGIVKPLFKNDYNESILK